MKWIVKCVVETIVSIVKVMKIMNDAAHTMTTRPRQKISKEEFNFRMTCVEKPRRNSRIWRIRICHVLKFPKIFWKFGLEVAEC